MKKWLTRLAVMFLTLSVGAAGAWWFFDKRKEPIPVRNISKPISANNTNAKRKSPMLGKDIPGLPEYCADRLISVSGCNGQTKITTDQGNTYRLAEIGNQCWFADNLKEIPTTEKGWYGYYDNAEEEPSPGEGMLYNWRAAGINLHSEREKGICPRNWHIPSDCELFAAEKNYGAKPSQTKKLTQDLLDYETTLDLEIIDREDNRTLDDTVLPRFNSETQHLFADGI